MKRKLVKTTGIFDALGHDATYGSSNTQVSSSYLEKLRSGDEIYWDYIPREVCEGKISRDDALGALEEGLRRHIIPRYEGWREYNPRYWGTRITSAKRTLDSISNPDPEVTFRGVTLGPYDYEQ